MIDTRIESAVPAVRPQRRWVVWVAAYASVIVLTALCLGGFGLARYAPLSIAGDTSQSPTGPGVTYQRTIAGAETDIVKFSSGREYSIGFTIRNTGRWGVTVTGIPLQDDGPGSMERVIGIQIAARNDTIGSVGFPMIPLRAFALAPGHTRFVLVHFGLNNCPSVQTGRGTYLVMKDVPIGFRLAGGIHRTESSALPFVVALDAYGGC